MSLLFTQSSCNGEITAERIDARLPAWLDHPSALIFPGGLVAGGRPNCEMKRKFTGNQFKSLWSYYSQVIMLSKPHLLYDSMFKEKSMYNRKGRKIEPPKGKMNPSFPEPQQGSPMLTNKSQGLSAQFLEKKTVNLRNPISHPVPWASCWNPFTFSPFVFETNDITVLFFTKIYIMLTIVFQQAHSQ